MSILFFDTETTGLPDFRGRSNDPKQPHIVQLAMLLQNDGGTEVLASSLLVRPNGWIIPTEAAAIHGITQERALDEGQDESVVVRHFILHQGLADLRVAHNESFDRRILRIAMTRAGFARDFIEAIEGRASLDTCALAKAIVNLPPTEKMLAAGFAGPKSPKLEECVKYFFGDEMAGAHDALVDVRACARVYHAIMARGAAA
jgi:DNA polymerase-3 subunit epsilon